jgi:hypothetical protein
LHAGVGWTKVGGWITGQDAVLLLLDQQARQDGAGLAGGEDTPGGHGQPPCGERTGGSSVGADLNSHDRLKIAAYDGLSLGVYISRSDSSVD